MTVPTGTAGTPTLGTVSPGSLSGGSIALAGTTLTFSFTSAAVIAGTAFSIQVNGLINTTVPGSYTSLITTNSGASGVDTGTTGAVILTSGALTSLTWSLSSTNLGTTGASYTYAFKTGTLSPILTSVTMTVPPGTAGTPTLGTVSPGSLSGGSIALAGTTLTFSFPSAAVTAGTAVSIQVNGLTNTTAPGSYTPEIVTMSPLAAVDSGVTPAMSITGPLSLTSPGSLSWAATLTGSNQGVVDTLTGDQQLTVNDATVTGAGWRITLAATTFTESTQTLPNIGILVFTGSISSVTAASAPSPSCVTSCTPPSDTVTYPVAITTASSSPPAATIYDTPAGTGGGTVALGGYSTADPAGWWIEVPANAGSGTYTSTVTLALVSGP